jgi:hypothetical protein
MDSIIEVCDTMESARAVAARFEHRKDLQMSDVCIRIDGRIIEGNLGPCR